MDLLELYNDQNYDIVIISDDGYILLTVKKGTICLELIELIEDNVDLDDSTETEEHAAKSSYVLEKYKNDIIKTGYDHNDLSDIQYDYDIPTDIDLLRILNCNNKFQIV